MPDNEILRARRQRITPEHIKETPADLFMRTMTDIAGAIAALACIGLVAWAVMQ